MTQRFSAAAMLAYQPVSPKVRVFLASFAMLFLELILIRWIPAFLRSFGFFTNFVLLASLLGAEIGMLSHRGGRARVPPLAITLAVLLMVTLLTRYSLVLASTEQLFYGSDATTPDEHLWVIPIIFFGVAVVFIPLGRELGRQFTVLAPLVAYMMDILGSLAGIATFIVISWFALPPVVWFTLAVIVAWLVAGGDARRVRLLSGVCFLGILVGVWITSGTLFQQGGGTVWSPYYRIQYMPNQAQDGYILSVNNIGHQEARPFRRKEHFYVEAYERLGTPAFERVLIIGAGTGSDVAAALAYGAGHVDAVEIDPALYHLGQLLHPDHPYDDPRVTMHIDDGRSFLHHTDTKFDLIIFALTNSLTLTSSQTSLRLESFLFTEESMREARDHLTGNGMLVLYNFYRQDWSLRKLAGMLTAAFQEPPYVVTYGAWGRAAVFMDGPRLKSLPAGADRPYQEAVAPVAPTASGDLPEIGRGRLGSDASPRPATDDWPFFYLRNPTFPRLYLGGVAMVLTIALAMVTTMAPRGTLRGFQWQFFFLGAAFMLLETRSIVTFALLFGTTWLVNALVFFAILVSVLCAILINARVQIRRAGPLFFALFILLAANYLVPVGDFLEIGPSPLRYLLASVLTFAPVFVANLVFSRLFRDTAHGDSAFAANLLGIMVGGLVEYCALLFGYQMLLVPAAALYLAAMVLARPGVAAKA